VQTLKRSCDKTCQEYVHSLKKRLKTRDNKIKYLEDRLKEAEEKGDAMKIIEDALNQYVSQEKRELFWNELRNNASTKKTYSENIKEFAMTMYYYNPKAYDFLREKLTLPHSATLRQWMVKCNCNPGFLQESFTYLEIAIKEKNYLRNVSLVFDSMAIRSQMVFDESSDKYCGTVDYGGIVEGDIEKFAREALFFQIVSYSQKFKLTIAYFLINGISAEIQSHLLREAIKKLYSIGVIVRSLTCDGTETNFSTMRYLGCDFSSAENMKTFFLHPSDETKKIYCIADPCHMIKLCRNTIAEKENITSPKGNISYQYIKYLHDLQEEINLKLANKLSREHIQYYKRKMNVRLAVQTISSSIADAIEYLKCQNYSRFIGSEATIEFLRIFDRLFDMMNARNCQGKHFKSPMSPHNLLHFKDVFLSFREYIQSLKINDVNILNDKRKTFALGFIINTYSFYNLASDLFAENVLRYFLPYKCSQDHLELTFSCIRNRGGWNNNPNCLQLKWALRQLFFKNSIKPSINANCCGEESESLSIFKFRKEERSISASYHNEDLQKDLEENDKFLTSLFDLMESVQISFLDNNILYYITGSIVHKLLLKIECKYCHEMLLRKTNNNVKHCYQLDPDKEINKYSSFTTFVNKGKLCFPSSTTYKIILNAEKAFLSEVNSGNFGIPHFKKNMIAAVIYKYLINDNIAFTPKHPVIDNDEDIHEMQLIKALVLAYANIRIPSYAKKRSLSHLGNRVNARQQLNKTVLFYNV